MKQRMGDTLRKHFIRLSHPVLADRAPALLSLSFSESPLCLVSFLLMVNNDTPAIRVIVDKSP